MRRAAAPLTDPWLAPLVLVAVFLAFALPASSRAAPPPDPFVDHSSAQPNSANQPVLWTSCRDIVGMTDAQLDQWRSRGLAAFACSTQRLVSLGGSQDWDPDLRAPLDGPQFAIERALRSSNIVGRASARGIRFYLTFYASTNDPAAATPFADWFDDAAWQRSVLHDAGNLAAAAHALGFVGLGLDQELYPQANNTRLASWNWDYPGNTHSEADTRAAARRRGTDLMSTILRGFPDVELIAYDTQLPGTWESLATEQAKGVTDPFGHSVQIDLWDGLTRVDGYRAIRFLDSVFYKTPQIPNATWDTALQYQDNSLFALLSQRLSNWSYASDRIFETPFAWIDNGSRASESARSPDYVAAQLAAFRNWGMGGMFAIYAFNDPSAFDYTPYDGALRAATQPGQVDDQPPVVTLTQPAPPVAPSTTGTIHAAGDHVMIAGTATDNLAVRAVRWSTDHGASGAVPMTFRIVSGSPATGWGWRMEWTATVPLVAGTTRIDVTVEDIKGLTSVERVIVDR